MSTPPLLRHDTILVWHNQYPPGSVERAKSLGMKLWSETKGLLASLRLVRGTAGMIDREEAWLALGVASQAELVEAIVGHVAGSDDVPVADVLTAIRSRLQPATDDQIEPLAADAVEEPASEESVVDALRERAFRLAQAGLISARQLASDIEHLHDYVGPGDWRSATRPDGSTFNTFREYAAYRNPPGLGFNEHDGAASVDAIVSRLIAFDPNRPAIAYLGGTVEVASRRGKKTARLKSTEPFKRDTKAEDERSTLDALLDELKAAGVRVEASGDRLRLLPASAVSEAIVARVRPHKASLLALLEARSRPARRGDRETPEEARDRVAAAEERLRLDREAFVEAAKRDDVYRGLAAGTGDDVA